MSGDPPNDQTPPRMPWEPEPPGEPEPPAPGATPPEPSTPETGWTPPAPTDPTTVWSPTPPAPPLTPPAGEPGSAPLAPGQGALLSSAPVGWAAPPPAAPEVAPGLTFADTGTRVIAYIVDVIILAIVGAIIGAIVDPTNLTADDFDDLMAANSPVAALLNVLVDAAYFIAFWTGGRRATIGQRLFNIQVGNAFDGRALSLEQAIRRWLAFGAWIGLLGVVPGLFPVATLLGLVWLIVLLDHDRDQPHQAGPPRSVRQYRAREPVRRGLEWPRQGLPRDRRRAVPGVGGFDRGPRSCSGSSGQHDPLRDRRVDLGLGRGQRTTAADGRRSLHSGDG